MRISIRAFASYRDAIGSPSTSLDVPEDSTPARVWGDLRSRYPGLQKLPPPVAFAVNDEYVPADRPLRQADELVLLPPLSGGQEPESTQLEALRSWVELVDSQIDVNGLLEKVRHPRAGAVVLFLGTVREHNRGRFVQYLEYEAYRELALNEMARVADGVHARWAVLGIAMVHRLGHLDVGEISVAVAVAAGHRREAFEAGRFAIDTLKQTVPIWKKEVWERGEVWIGSEPTGAAGSS